MEVLLLAVGLDLLIGDPQTRLHPVALVGRLISWLEQICYPRGSGRWIKRLAGAVMVMVTVAAGWAVTYYLLRWLSGWSKWAYILAGGVLLWGTISVRSLDRAANRIGRLLREGDWSGARRELSMIVGRDTADLDESEMARATVETVAENISDGTIAPLCYFLIGGVPLAWAYRIINTFDSMVGYKNERYLDFGFFAAKLDDLANLLPARISALLLVGSALLLRLDWRRAWRVMCRDRHRHPSPNSGYPEATVAGALGIQLGGTNYYGGVVSHRPLMGDPVKPLVVDDIAAVVRVVYGSLILFLATYGLVYWLAIHLGSR